MEEGAGERHAFNGTAERWSFFTVARLCSQKRDGEREGDGKREDRYRDRGGQSDGMGVQKLGPLHSSTTELLREG